MAEKTNLRKFTIEGLEMREKDVKQYPNQGSRIIVPKGWKKVVLIRIE